MPAAPTHAGRRPIVVTLARDPFRIIAWLLFRLAIGEIGVVVGLGTPGGLGTAVTLAGVAVFVYVVVLSVHVLTLRIEIRPGEIHVVSGPIRRRYGIIGGTAERIRISRRQRWFSTALGGFGIEMGPGLLANREAIDVYRLDPGSSVVLIRADSTRLAVAASHEARFLRALEGAGVRVQAHTEPADSR